MIAANADQTTFVAILRSAALTALAALVLAIPLLGFETLDLPQGLGIGTRSDLVFKATIVVFLGRIVVGLWPLLPKGAARGWAAVGLVTAVAIAADFWNGRPFRFDRLVAGVAVGLVIQALLALRHRVMGGGQATPGARSSTIRVDRWLAVVLIVAAGILPLTPLADRYVIDLGTTIIIYVMLGWGLNVVVGLAGLLDLGYVAFYAVGAYSFALLARDFGLTFWECLPLAGVFAATFGVLLGFPVLRLRGDYLAIVTLGFGEMIRIVLINFQAYTGGPNGVRSIPRPTFFGHPFTDFPDPGVVPFHQFLGIEYSTFHRIAFLYYVILALATLTFLFTERIRRLPVGRAWEALREDEVAARALGINPTNTKLTAFAIGAMFGGFAGAFFATRQGFISPESFTFIESAMVLAIVVLGGMGSQVGVALAAAVLVVLPELGRGSVAAVPAMFPEPIASGVRVIFGLLPDFGVDLDLGRIRMLVFGGAMIAIMIWRPRGLLSRRDPSIRLKSQGRAAAGAAAE